MITTGIVRRIDDLGRVVIPREIRRTLNIREGDPLELFTSKINGRSSIVFQKYDMTKDYDFKTLDAILQIAADGHPYVLCDNNSDVISDHSENYTDDKLPIDFEIQIDGQCVAFISTTSCQQGCRLVQICQTYFKQYEL